MIFMGIEIHLFKIRLTAVAIIKMIKIILPMNQEIILRINIVNLSIYSMSALIYSINSMI